jgi:hypothetical protein
MIDAALGDVAGADWSDDPLTRLCDALEAERRPPRFTGR